MIYFLSISQIAAYVLAVIMIIYCAIDRKKSKYGIIIGVIGFVIYLVTSISLFWTIFAK